MRASRHARLMPWSDTFDDLVSFPNGNKAATLEDAALFIQRLPKADQQRPHWQLAVETLINTAEGRDLIFDVRVAMTKASWYSSVSWLLFSRRFPLVLACRRRSA